MAKVNRLYALEVEKWAAIFRMLFPGDVDTPSPYYEYGDSDQILKSSTGLEESAAWGSRNDMPRNPRGVPPGYLDIRNIHANGSRSHTAQHTNNDHQQNPGSGQKRARCERHGNNREQDSGSGSDESNESGDDGRRKKPKKTSPCESIGMQYLACPFFQHNPVKYGRWRGCPGPGWPTINRLKEHLHRRHRLPKFPCLRCCEGFDNHESLKKQLRREDMCPLKPEPNLEGIDDSLEEKLKSRKGLSKLSESEKWVRIYQILFDGEPAPVPYYHHNRPKLLVNGNNEIREKDLGQIDYEAQAAVHSYEDKRGLPQAHIPFEDFENDNFLMLEIGTINFDSCFDFNWNAN
ncbi:hypothetical protein F4820DRAFT_411387 [Hypoxylon rubiginosum]|uniref:Uncharacterized protein n=1 Tax=Hypoxylon rubiginosum TaxID=110542 RepID=A0ACB9Z9P8_9PEZI|nr:hypothetical protein F4820DRAFT_411387 [Hypoxylon rubiginosum]